MGIQVERNHYLGVGYDTKERFISYWHQINAVSQLHGDRILEIGIGNGFVSRYLKNLQFNVTTMDIDMELQPDVVGNICQTEFENDSFDTVLCCEVLEHLPYENSKIALLELFRISKAHVIISLPDISRTLTVSIKSHKLGNRMFCIPLPRLFPKVITFNGEHYWEIGAKFYPLKRIAADIKNAGFVIKSSFRVFEYPYHRIFILSKQS